jgi:hypothetical protein
MQAMTDMQEEFKEKEKDYQQKILECQKEVDQVTI